MPPVTRSQKRAASRGRTPTRVTAARIAYNTPMSISPRGRSMTRATSRQRSTSSSLARWMGSNSKVKVVAAGGPSSGGKLYTYRMGKARSRTVKARRQAALGGIVHCQETTGIVQDANCVYLGHALPIWQLRQASWWAVFRHVLLHAGATVGELGLGNIITAASVGVVGGDTFALTYRLNSTAAIATITHTVVLGESVEAGVNVFAQNAAIDVATVEFLHFVYTPVAASPLKRSQVKLDLLSLRINFKSSLKLQNRTLGTTTDTSTDEPDNCPIYGKSYGGPGLGVSLRPNVSQNITGFTANTTTGLINVVAGGNTGLQEPLQPQQLEKVTQSGRIHLQPGEVKTSVISKNINVRFGFLMNTIAPAPAAAGAASAGVKVNGRFSQYRIFGMEKMMDVQSGTLTNVTIAFENDSKMFISCKQKYENPTIQHKVLTYRI